MKTLRQIKEQLEIPAIGQTLSRDLMPQIDSTFLKYLKSKYISYTKEQLNTGDLKSTQSEFDDVKIISLMHQNDSDPIFVSNDNYVLDGHHRWIADHNTSGKTEAYVINLPILELLRVAKEYESMLKEEVTHKDFGPMMDSFVSFASDKLGIKSLPKINYKTDDEQGEQPSFGGYNPSTNEIIICTKNRHPMDVFRTLAHELIHHKQNEDGRIKDISKEGATGSSIEDEANSLAGRLMRMFGKSNPDKFALQHIIEEFQSTLSAYSPQRPKSKTIGMEGGYASSRPGPGQDRKNPKTWKVRTLQDYNPDDPTSYVTLAGNRDLYGKQVTIPSITYKTPEGEDVTHKNVRAHVHDTGGAFKNKGRERLDVAVGHDITGNLGNQPFSMKSHTLRKGWDTSDTSAQTKQSEPPKESPQLTQAKPNIPTGEPPANSPQYDDAKHDSNLMPTSKPTTEKPNIAGNDTGTDNYSNYRRSSSGQIARLARQVNEGSLHKWFKSSSDDGKEGWVQIGGKYQGKPCARQSGQTSTPKCRSSDEASRMTKDQIKYAVAKKRREDPNQHKKKNAAEPTRVSTYKRKHMNEEKDIKGKSSGKKDACYYKVKARYDVWPSAYASGALVKCRQKGADNWGKKSIDEEFENLTEAKKINKKAKVVNTDKSVFGKALMAAQKMQYAEKQASKGKKGQKRKDYAAHYAMQDPVALVKAHIAKHSPKPETKLAAVSPTTHAAPSEPPKPMRPSQVHSAPTRPYLPPDPKPYIPHVSYEKLKTFDDHIKHYEDTGKWNHKKAVSSIHNEYTNLIGDADPKNKDYIKNIHSYYKRDLQKAKKINRISKGKHPEGIGTRILKALRLREENTQSDRGWGTDSLTRIYAEDTPGQSFPPETYPKNPLFEKKKFVRKKKIEEDGMLGSTLDMYNTPYTLPSSDTIGPEFGNRYSGITGFGSGIQSSIGTGYSYPFGTLAEDHKPIHFNQLRENWEAIGGHDMGTVGKGTDEKRFGFDEKSEAWTRKEGQDPEGGLNRKGIASYRRANPGSKLSMAVTTKPSKLKKSSKAWKRRKSYCARSAGQMKDFPRAAKDPNSRLRKARRKWNCEE